MRDPDRFELPVWDLAVAVLFFRVVAFDQIVILARQGDVLVAWYDMQGCSPALARKLFLGHCKGSGEVFCTIQDDAPAPVVLKDVAAVVIPARVMAVVYRPPLRLSEGKLDQLEHAIALAKADWRDLLMAAGFEHDVDAHTSLLPVK
ncbi:MAG TPA: hypothetical protein VGJ20_31435 [Xanthobacteraceae bacterium]